MLDPHEQTLILYISISNLMSLGGFEDNSWKISISNLLSIHALGGFILANHNSNEFYKSYFNHNYKYMRLKLEYNFNKLLTN